MLILINKFIKLSSIEKQMFLEAYLVSLYSRMLILLSSFKSLEKKLGSKTEKRNCFRNENIETMKLIKRSIIRSSKYCFWRNKCFEQSLTAAIMFKRRKIPYVLYLGVAKKEEKLIAHVWIESNGYFVVNKGKVEYFTLSTYFG